MDTTQQICENCKALRAENKIRSRLMEAVLFSNLEGLKAGLEQLQDLSFVENIDFFMHPTALYHLTLFNKEVWDPYYWIDLSYGDQNIVKWMARRTEQVIDFWREYLGVEELPKPEYEKYLGEFFSAWPEDSDEDILDAPRSAFLAKGCREIDIDLYLSTERFEFDKVESLLRQGADPCARLSYDGNDELYDNEVWAYHFTGLEIGHLIMEMMELLREVYQGNEMDFDDRYYDYLLGLAEHTRMEKLFDKYVYIWGQRRVDSRPEKCERCGEERILPLVYGELTPEQQLLAQRDEIELGGRYQPQYPADWRCTECGMEYIQRQ